MPTEAERLDHIAARLASLFNGERSAGESNPACVTIYNEFLKEIGREYIDEEGGPDLECMLKEIQPEKVNVVDDEKEGEYSLPADDFFYGIGWVAYSRQDEITDYDVLQHPLGEMVSDKEFRAVCPPIFFSWCILLLEKLAMAMDREATSTDFVESTDQMLNAVYFYLYERTDTTPPQMIMDNALRIMRSASKVVNKPKFWPSYLRIIVTRCLRTREIPFAIQEMCYKLTCQAAWMLGPRFWSNDEQFVRVVAAMVAIHWRLMLEGLADREPLVSAYSLFLEIFLVCEERNRISDQTAICVASNCKEIMESVAGYIKGEDQNPEPIREGQRYIVTALMSTLVSTGAFQMIHEDDEKAIVDWWLKHSIDQSDMFRQLMLCSTFIRQLDSRVMTALAGYYERCVSGDVPEEEADMMVLHWVVKLIQEKRTDFYDKTTLSDCVARLERVRTPKKYVDALKKLKC